MSNASVSYEMNEVDLLGQCLSPSFCLVTPPSLTFSIDCHFFPAVVALHYSGHSNSIHPSSSSARSVNFLLISLNLCTSIAFFL